MPRSAPAGERDLRHSKSTLDRAIGLCQSIPRWSIPINQDPHIADSERRGPFESGGSSQMSQATVAEKKKSGLRIPGFAQLQRLGKSLMLPIALLPAAGILLRLGQPDLLGGIDKPVIGPFFDAMSAAGGAIFANLPLLFAIGVAIGFAKKADGSTALAAAAGYLVIAAVFKIMSPIVLEGEVDQAGAQAQINYSVFAGIAVGLVTALLFDKYHTISLPPYLGFFGGRRFVPIVVSVTCLIMGFGLSYFYPIFNA